MTLIKKVTTSPYRNVKSLPLPYIVIPAAGHVTPLSSEIIKRATLLSSLVINGQREATLKQSEILKSLNPAAVGNI